MEEKNLVVSPIVTPAVTPQEAKDAWNKYLDLKKEIIDDSDVQKIQGKDFLKKSYWRKVERFFNLKLECLKEERIIKERKNGTENIAYLALYRAIAPNGSFCDGDGFCETWEKNRFNNEHNVRATAHTRAKNRAISDLVGGGEVSAEEISEDASVEPLKQENIDEPPHELPAEESLVKKEYLITEKQRKMLYARWKQKELADEYVRTYLKYRYGIDSTNHILKEWFNDILEWVEKQVK
jgi:hypothetical protein